ncbi:MAG: NOP58 family protein [Candidatus Thermoplasmatota archaeon]|nr:NOP58 family protein [Candidatus Thermoplasmatota archaeon]
MLMHTQWYGTFILERHDGGWRVIDFKGAPKNPEKIASEIRAITEGDILDRERELASTHDITHTTEERLKTMAPGAELVEIWDLEVPPAHEKGYGMDLIIEANALKASAKRAQSIHDGNIMSAVGALKDIDSSLNLVSERLREWYGRYWPEVVPLLEDRELLSILEKDANPSAVIKAAGERHPGLVERIEGIALPEVPDRADLSGISGLAALANSLWASREDLERYIEKEMETVSPDLSIVAGPLVGARLIHSAGGLSRLARLPASTVQVLGAEKMFFKFLKEGGKPPKHGVLFQHPWVHSLPDQKRGRMARSLASAASLAARMDAFGGGDPLPVKERLERRAKEIREMPLAKRTGGGRQPPFREGWWANKARPAGGRKRQRRRRK